MYTTPSLSGISTLSQEIGENTLESQFRLTVVLGFGIPFILYQKLLCLLLVCTSPRLSLISTLKPGRHLTTLDSQLCLTMQVGFGLHLYTLPEVIVPTLGVPLSNTFRYFYS